MVGANPEEGETLIIQVYLNADFTPSKNYPYAGWRGTPGDEWCWPVVFMPEGEVDHGGQEGTDPDERFSDMQIYDRPFKEGDRYVMKHREGSPDTHYVVESIEIEKRNIEDAEKKYFGHL